MEKDFWHDFVAGWMGGCLGLVVGHPLDTIKVRQQVLKKIGILKCLGNTFRFEGVHGFYKGLGFPLVATGTLNSLFFGVYGNVLRVNNTTGSQIPSYSSIFCAGCTGGLVQLIVACPVDLVKIKLQVQVGDAGKQRGIGASHPSTTNYKGPISCLKDLYKQRGIRGWYYGLPTMIVRDVPSFGLYMIVYEAFIRNLSGSEDKASNWTLILSGGMAGVVAWASVVPLDVVKSRIQSDNPSNPKYKGLMDCIVKSYRQDGLGVFARGFTMVTLRALPTNGAIFLGYVTTLNFFRT